MTQDIKDVVSRSGETMLNDALGLAALVVLLVGALCLPGLL